MKGDAKINIKLMKLETLKETFVQIWNYISTGSNLN